MDRQLAKPSLMFVLILVHSIPCDSGVGSDLNTYMYSSYNIIIIKIKDRVHKINYRTAYFMI